MITQNNPIDGHSDTKVGNFDYRRRHEGVVIVGGCGCGAGSTTGGGGAYVTGGPYGAGGGYIIGGYIMGGYIIGIGAAGAVSRRVASA
jgi:hypothetical protein